LKNKSFLIWILEESFFDEMTVDGVWNIVVDGKACIWMAISVIGPIGDESIILASVKVG
jgi:hypothetical protein